MKRRLISFTLVLMLILTMVAGSTVAFAETTGLKEQDGELYYYENGQMVKDCFKEISGYKYYFGNDGAAYKPSEDDCEWVKCCLVKNINGINYGFNGKGRMVTGLWADINGKGWIFNKNGTQNVAKTKKLRKMLRSKKASKKLLKNVKKLIGKPRKTKIGNSCNNFGTARERRRDKFLDYTLRYKNADITLVKNKRTGKYRMNGIFGKDIY